MYCFCSHKGRNPSLAIQFLEECVLMGKFDYAEKFVAVAREKEPDVLLRDEVSILNYSNFAKSRTAEENVKLLVDMERLGLIFYEGDHIASVLAKYASVSAFHFRDLEADLRTCPLSSLEVIEVHRSKLNLGSYNKFDLGDKERFLGKSQKPYTYLT